MLPLRIWLRHTQQANVLKYRVWQFYSDFFLGVLPLHPLTSLNVTPPPLRAVNLKSSGTPQQQRQRSQGNIIWSPASMCERSARREQFGLKMEEQGYEDEHQVDPIVRKFKYERRTASIQSLQSPISSLSAPPSSNSVQDLEFEVAQQQLYAHRNAFMAGLTGNNLELLTQHLKQKSSEQPQQQQHRIKDEQQDSRSAAALMNLVAAAEFGYMRNQHQQPQQQQQQQQLHHQQQHQQHHQQQQQHPDSTATDVARRSSSSSSYQGENEEKRSGRNFQVSRLKTGYAQGEMYKNKRKGNRGQISGSWSAPL